MKERVCDTVYETELTEKDDYKCITVMNPYCAKKDRTVYDKTCRTMVNFDCKAQGGNSYGAGSSGSGDSGYGGSDGGYGEGSYEPEYKCQRSHETKCYTTRRTVSSDYCEDREEKVCEKMTEWFLFQLKGKIVMTKTRKCANLSNGPSLSKSKNTYIVRNVNQGKNQN